MPIGMCDFWVSNGDGAFMTCWAASLGNCARGTSREHLVSDAIFVDDRVRVSGFPWCGGSTKTIGLKALTAKILCVQHNNDLSDVDSAGAHAFDVFRQSRTVANERAQLEPGNWQVVEYHVDGLFWERWLLKTLINISLDGDYPIGSPSATIGQPDPALVDIAFGRKRFEPKAGLYFVVHTGQQVVSDDTLGFSPVLKDRLYVIGGLFRFRGIRLLLHLSPDGPPERLTGLGLGEEDWGQSQLNYHNKRIDVTCDHVPSQIIHIDW